MFRNRQRPFMRQLIRWKMALLNLTFKQSFLCCIFLGFIIFVIRNYYSLSSDISAIYERHRGRGGIFSFRPQSKEKRKLLKKPVNCTIFSLGKESKWTPQHSSDHNGCQRIIPVAGSCSVADELFFSKPPASCSHQRVFDFCSIESTQDGKWRATCNETETKRCVSSLSLGTVDPETGELKWQDTETVSEAAELLTTIVQTEGSSSIPQHYGFCFVRCQIETEVPKDSPSIEDRAYYNDDDDGRVEQGDYVEQLIILPPNFRSQNSQSQASTRQNINFNIILVDSVSRQHFFRSLKQSVEVLQNINMDPNSAATVLDFKLVQAVRSRTFETLQTIFSADLDPLEKTFGIQDIPPKPLRLAKLLEKVKSKGYYTLWQEDLCYLWEWGISKDLHFLDKENDVAATWIKMWQKLAENKLDSVDLTLAMCEILQANDVADHFHGPDSVCFNGRHQHEYLLEYSQMYQQARQVRGQPYFSFTETNVGHEDTGRRVQTLDKALAQYLKSVSRMQNTLTIIFSDHGNAYGRYMQKTPEASIELFHPFMFFIAPDSVAKILGQDAMTSLGLNTERLVSFLDLHHTLLHLIDPTSTVADHNKHFSVSNRGLFEPVSFSRTCNDIPRVMPNICICQNYDMSIKNDTHHNIFAYFALGKLNDEIQGQLKMSRKSDAHRQPAFGNCQRLELVGVQNLRKSFGTDGSQKLKMELHVQESQIFFVAVTIKDNFEGQGHHKTVLDRFDRLTQYSKYSVCADKIDLPLCICDIHRDLQNSIPKLNIPQLQHYSQMNLLPHFESILQKVNCPNDCMLLVIVKHEKGAVIFGANQCKGESFILSVILNTDDTIVYSSPPTQPLVQPGGMVVVGLIYSEKDETWTGSVQVDCHTFTV